MTTSSRFAVAVHILTLLAGGDGPIPSTLIAGSVGTNPALIRRLISRLAEAGLVASEMGSQGGATLARPAAKITLLEIFRAVESTDLIALHRSAPNPACTVGKEITGVLQRVAEKAQAAMDGVLADLTIADMLSQVRAAGRRGRR
ncbi:rrf2 family transcriptional regulator [Pandoraea thiooxydans]|uniref:Rrf2 family transcriptional regulator n=1 Tax=Pandoraea thiooxydans TaxID=445709 RepID=A0A0G3ERN6_9BURK|nr:Rrf2 family transcriptional regulator [Pandoraea thiooxydans]AKJ69743.1 Rrf2 family transcriptional regulator [Pandoraea thiooxydans]APR97486.1 rrf2 family transcriptional regulator [Pandoraea thiooxydans]